MKDHCENETNESKSFGSLARVFWGDLRDAVRGRERDYTNGSMGKAILLLAIPMILEMVMESIFAVVDVFFVAKLGSAAVATIGLTESVLTLLFAIAIGLSMATTAMVARRVGEKRKKEAREAAVQAIVLGIFISIPISIVGIVFASDILRLMGATEEVIRTGSTNVAIMLGGNVTIMLLFLINAIFRGSGNPATAMRVLWIANGVNIILDPCLIFGWGPFPEMGVTGAAVATNIGRGTGVLLQVYLLLKGSGSMKIDVHNLRLQWGIMGRILKVSLGGIFQWIIATSSWVAIVRIVAIFGSDAIAGYTIGIRIIVFAILPSWGLSNAAATLVGQNLGAKKPERAERSVWITGVYNMIFLGSVAVVFLVFARFLVGIFTDDPMILEHGVRCLRFISSGYVFFALGMVITQSFNGAGDTMTPTAINFFCYWVFQIPFVYLLAIVLKLETTGIYIGIALAESLLAVVGAMVFRRGKWKTQEI